VSGTQVCSIKTTPPSASPPLPPLGAPLPDHPPLPTRRNVPRDNRPQPLSCPSMPKLGPATLKPRENRPPKTLTCVASKSIGKGVVLRPWAPPTNFPHQVHLMPPLNYRPPHHVTLHGHLTCLVPCPSTRPSVCQHRSALPLPRSPMPSATRPPRTDDALMASLTVRLRTLDGIPPCSNPHLTYRLCFTSSYIQVMFHSYLTLLIVSLTSYANVILVSLLFHSYHLPHLLRTSVVYKPCTLVG
jgi:hypothetical protein